MLTLLLFRHAKSDWSADLADHERPLNKRGVKAAPLVARHIASSGQTPDRILCSDAARTRATLSLALTELPNPAPAVDIDERLYLAAAETILDVIRERAGKTDNRLMVIGHNPGLHALALTLIGNGDKKSIGTMATKFPTAALAIITFDTDTWTGIGPASGTLVAFLVPRDLD
ncbi:MAG: hypothetical protein APF80_03735 [Alphaproteobacteria bacterium BRH_c36]|nr:MAG: hypothetical protein APF80_03735 [Alphaproteobacteria bacterium BRH_c36]